MLAATVMKFQDEFTATEVTDVSENHPLKLSEVIATYKRELEFFEQHADGTDEENEELAARTFEPPLNALINWDRPAENWMEALEALNLPLDIIGVTGLSTSMINAAMGCLDRPPYSTSLTDVIAWHQREVEYYNKHSGKQKDALADRAWRLPEMLLRQWNRPAASAEEAIRALRYGAEDLLDEGLHSAMMRAATLYLEATIDAAQN